MLFIYLFLITRLESFNYDEAKLTTHLKTNFKLNN